MKTQGEMVDDQTANQTAKSLKRGKKKRNKKICQFRNSTILALVVLVLLLQHLNLSVCVF
jgi:hypothetical protein